MQPHLPSLAFTCLHFFEFGFESKFVFAFKFCLTKVKASEGKKNRLHSCNCLFYCVLNGKSEEVKANEQMMQKNALTHPDVR